MKEYKKINEELYYKEIAKNIRRIRKEKKYTQAALAEKMDVSHEYIRRIESAKGRCSFSMPFVFKAALSLEVSLKDLCDIDLYNIKDES